MLFPLRFAFSLRSSTRLGTFSVSRKSRVGVRPPAQGGGAAVGVDWLVGVEGLAASPCPYMMYAGGGILGCFGVRWLVPMADAVRFMRTQAVLEPQVL